MQLNPGLRATQRDPVKSATKVYLVIIQLVSLRLLHLFRLVAQHIAATRPVYIVSRSPFR